MRIADKPADRSHQYGHAKAENLVALGQMIVLGVFVIVLGAEAIGRLAEEGILYMSLLTDPTYGGVSASFAFHADT